MCGIFAYSGPRNDAISLVIQGLKHLEYRGYDSWGIAAITDRDEIYLNKTVGKIGSAKEETSYPSSNLAMGHSRWATHGGVTEINAHPQCTENQEIMVVHNGIFENYLEVKHQLVKKGHKFVSETDTEVFAHLVEDFRQQHPEQSLKESVRMALLELEGRFAVLVLAKNRREIVAARKGSPLIVGVGKTENEYYIASDITAFLDHTNRLIYLDDHQLTAISPTGINFSDFRTGKEIVKRVITVNWQRSESDKGDHAHFMIKEIMEQKNTLRKSIEHEDEEIMNIAQVINQAYGTYLVGCGTAGKVCLAATYFFAAIAKKHINFQFGSEFPYLANFIKPGSLLIAVSQSGETTDTLEAVEVAKAKGAKVLTIVNVESSTMAREADFTLALKAGPEKAVASTKATTAQLAILHLLAYACTDRLQLGKQVLVRVAAEINDMLNPRYEGHIATVANRIQTVESMYIIGRGANYPIALEAAIKLQEVSYIHAQGFAGGELKHGPLALITKGTPVIALVANDETRTDILSNTIEIKARGGFIIGVAPENSEIFDFWIKVPDVGGASPIVNIIPLQILAYQLAVLRQNNPDMPRNLAKSVTVK